MVYPESARILLRQVIRDLREQGEQLQKLIAEERRRAFQEGKADLEERLALARNLREAQGIRSLPEHDLLDQFALERIDVALTSTDAAPPARPSEAPSRGRGIGTSETQPQAAPPSRPVELPKLPRAIHDPPPIPYLPPDRDRSPAEIAAELQLPQDNRNYWAPIPKDDENFEMMADGLDVVMPGAGRGVKAVRGAMKAADDAADLAKAGRKLIDKAGATRPKKLTGGAELPSAKQIDKGVGKLDDATKTSRVGGEAAPQQPGQLYDVGPAKDLRKNPIPDTAAHHVPQSREAESVVGGHNPRNKAGNEAAIRVANEEHDLITQAQRTRTAPASARDLLADDIRMLRKHTGAPRQKMKDLIELNKKRHPPDYSDLHRTKGIQ